MNKKVCLFGHSDFVENKNLEKKIKDTIIYCVKCLGITEFLLGGYGNFDWVCAKYIYELKETFPQIKSYLVLAYLDKKFDKYKKQYIDKIYDGTIYPPIENVPKKFAIIKRNKWIVENSDFIIFYVNFSFGGAFKMLEYSCKKKKKYINLGTKKL